jgi:glycosyltransferase involved in cell wall biosynthesis
MQKTIVVSAVNLKVGGTPTILRDCLAYLSTLAASGEYRVVALVYQKELALYPHIEYIEMQWPKKRWVNRLWCEYVSMKKISRQLAPVFLWLSLHDTTPSVVAERRAVYCHNSFPFYRWSFRELFFSPKIVLFALFSKYAYKVNIHKNQAVIVQQQWFKDEFIRMFGLNKETIIISPPSPPKGDTPVVSNTEPFERYSFFFPAAPDSHKNYQCICQAAQWLEKELPDAKFDVYMTIKGDENKYVRWLYSKWGKTASLNWIGYLNKEALYTYYNRSQCLLFPSKVETWGLPITEFATFHKPMLLADLPYAHETGGGAEQVAFFDPEDPRALANQMKQLITGDSSLLHPVERPRLTPPVADSWADLFTVLLKK